MTDRVRGRVLIININKFSTTDKQRTGSQVDYDNISRLFKDLRFSVAKTEAELTNLTAEVPFILPKSIVLVSYY